MYNMYRGGGEEAMLARLGGGGELRFFVAL